MFGRVNPLKYLDNFARFKLKPSRQTGGGLNFHRSNRAKEGLFHGKDVRSGNSISFSHKKTLRKWYPNVINKRVYSECLDQFIRFRMTTTALKEIDNVGGIDNYILLLDERSVTDSKQNTRVRELIASTLFHQGKLGEKFIKRFGFHKQPPLAPEEIREALFRPIVKDPHHPNREPLTPVHKVKA